MVGIVIVSHSYQLAAGVKELADSLTAGRVPIAAAGGLDEHTLGTTVDRVLAAIQEAWRGEGVLVLVDLGSSVLNTTLALELLPEDVSKSVVLSPAPLVEAAILTALRADAGGDLAQVLEAASMATSFPKGEVKASLLLTVPEPGLTARVEGIVQLTNPLGLHARPAARIVQIIRDTGTAVYLSKVGSDQPPVCADSLLSLLILNGHQGDQLLISAEGDDAQAAFNSIKALILSGFHDLP